MERIIPVTFASSLQYVTTVTCISFLFPHNRSAMARRSIGVVLIVALLGWTVSVNQPLFACTGLHSRAAVAVPAGTPPALKPEPSPSHHNCCPSVSQKPPSSDAPSHCSSTLQISANHNCCSVSHSAPITRPLLISRVSKLDSTLTPPAQCTQLVRTATAVAVSFENSPPPSQPASVTVLRN